MAAMPVDNNIQRSEVTRVGANPLGAGAFGVVWRGRWRGTDVAIKTLTSSSPEAVKDLLNEIATLKRVSNHKHIVQFFGACVDGGEVFIVMEFMARGSMEDILCKGPWRSVPFPDVLDMLAQACAGLLHLKFEQVVHRDIALRNLFVDQYGIVKLGDFGLAYKKSHGSAASVAFMDVGPIPWMVRHRRFLNPLPPPLTLSSNYPLPPFFHIFVVLNQAPEQIQQGFCTISSDVYMLGCTILEATTAQRPWAKPQLPTSGIIMSVGQGLRSPIPPWVPSELYTIIMACCRYVLFRLRFRLLRLTIHLRLNFRLNDRHPAGKLMPTALTLRLSWNSCAASKRQANMPRTPARWMTRGRRTRSWSLSAPTRLTTSRRALDQHCSRRRSRAAATAWRTAATVPTCCPHLSTT